MSIECNVVKGTVDDSIFIETDRMVMKAAYAAHNHFGRLCDEHVYENDVADRLIAEGVECVATQVPLRVRHKSFEKTYRLDLVVNGCVYEFKATDALIDAHQAQVLHYAALLNRNRIKLINFGAPRVEGQLVGTPFAEVDRWDVSVDRERWRPISKNCDKLVGCAEELLHSWGGFLHYRLFRKALAWFSGRDCCEQRLPVTRTSRTLGRHRVLLHDSRCGFVVTSLHDDLSCYESQLRRLLDALPIDGWQWLNFYHRELKVTSIVK